jgi:hypothetical protein
MAWLLTAVAGIFETGFEVSGLYLSGVTPP